jgi:hypothetical protein
MASTPTTEALVRTFVKIRDARSNMKSEFETADGRLKESLRTVENELLRRAQDQGVKQFKTDDGTAYIGEEQHVSMSDAEVFRGFVEKSGDLLFYEQRVSLGHVKEYMDANEGKLPPGVNFFRENRMRVRANRKKGEEDVA